MYIAILYADNNTIETLIEIEEIDISLFQSSIKKILLTILMKGLNENHSHLIDSYDD